MLTLHPHIPVEPHPGDHPPPSCRGPGDGLRRDTLLPRL